MTSAYNGKAMKKQVEAEKGGGRARK